MLKRKRLGRDVFLRGVKGQIRSIYSSKYSLTLFEVLKPYATIIMTIVIVIFAEVLPKTYALNRPNRTALLISPIIYYLNKFLSYF